MTKIKRNLSLIKINDVFDELSNENKRLSDQLMVANKCLNIFEKFKTFVDLVFTDYKIDFNSNDSKNYQKLREDISEALSDLPKNAIIAEDGHLDVEQNSQQITDQSLDQNLEPIDVSDNENKTYPKRKQSYYKKKYKNETNLFKCDSCGKSYSSVGRLNIHRKTVHSLQVKINLPEIEKLKCTINGCNYETKKDIYLVNHINSHKGLKPFKCYYKSCGKRFVSQQGLNFHNQTIHRRFRRFKCDFIGCDFDSVKRYQLLNHKNTVHELVRPFSCTQCEATFGCGIYLRTHIKLMHETVQKSINCKDCDKCFKSVSSLNYHYRTVHLNIKTVREKLFACDEHGCSFRTDIKSKIKTHKKTVHSTERPFQCTFTGCTKAFKQRGHMSRHYNEKHLGILYKCKASDCGLSFKCKTTRNLHYDREHTGQLFRCEWPGCDYQAKLIDYLKRHRKTHKTVADICCDWPECHKTFKSRVYLNLHMRIHTNDKRYSCDWPGCHYQCGNRSNFLKHGKVHDKK